MTVHVVYRAYDASGQLLYVGMSSALERRLDRHKAEADWWRAQVVRVEVEQLPSRWHAYQHESELISQLRPPYNQRPGPRSPHPKWLARDERIVRLRQEGKLRREIAEELGISEKALQRALKRLLAAGRIMRRPPGLAPKNA